jgi:hypothetical protein
MEFNQIVNGVPLVFVVFGLVALLKNLGVRGKVLLVCSLLLGIAFGVAYQYSLRPIVGFGGWFGAVMFGLALGITASGVYEGIKNAMTADAPKG